MINIEAELIKEEGISLTPYKDTLGNWTVGVGHLLPFGLKNYPDITLEQAGIFLTRDVSIATAYCVQYVPNFNRINEVRQYVLISMMFNLGITKFLQFKRMIEALKVEDYTAAADEMLDSKWAKQVPNRAKKLFKMMKDGECLS